MMEFYSEVIIMDTYSQFPKTGSPSDRMETISLTLAGAALLSCLLPYISLPCGALAVIFATLSRSGQMRYGAKAQAGLVMGITALTITIVLYVTVFILIYFVYGSVDAFMDAYSRMSGTDYREMMEQLMPSTQFQ